MFHVSPCWPPKEIKIKIVEADHWPETGYFFCLSYTVMVQIKLANARTETYVTFGEKQFASEQKLEIKNMCCSSAW